MERWRKGIQLKDAQTNKNTQNELKIEKKPIICKGQICTCKTIQK